MVKRRKEVDLTTFTLLVDDEGTEREYKDDDALVLHRLSELNPVINDLAMNDDQVVKELMAIYPNMRWCPELKALIIPWENGLYKQVPIDVLYDKISHLNALKREWASSMVKRAPQDWQRKRALKLVDFAEKCSNGGRMKQIAELFCRRSRIDHEKLDSNPSMLGTLNGVVDLNSGRVIDDLGLDPLSRNITHCCNALIDSCERYLALEEDRRWYKFIDEIMCGDKERADYLQRVLGYTLYGGNPEECMFIFYGATTRNGKNTLLDAVQNALGDYATSTERGFLLDSGKMGGTDEALASLVGKRLVTMSEPPKGKKLDESKVKSLCSCDYQSTSKKYGAQFEFQPQFTMIMSCNHLPEVSDDSVFASKRIRVIPFERHFEPDEQDKNLKDRFESDKGAWTVLSWLLDGYQMYLERGLEEPESVRRTTEAYADTGGTTVDKFIRNCCAIETGAKCENKMFQGAYKDYCEHILLSDPVTAQALRKELEPLGITKKPSDGKEYWVGVRLAVGFPLSSTENTVDSEKEPPEKKRKSVKLIDEEK